MSDKLIDALQRNTEAQTALAEALITQAEAIKNMAEALSQLALAYGEDGVDEDDDREPVTLSGPGRRFT